MFLTCVHHQRPLTLFFLLRWQRCFFVVVIDDMQVLDLGITRLLVHRLARLLPHMCAGHAPRWGSLAAALNDACHRLLFLGRRSKASRVAPGYVHGTGLAALV